MAESGLSAGQVYANVPAGVDQSLAETVYIQDTVATWVVNWCSQDVAVPWVTTACSQGVGSVNIEDIVKGGVEDGHNVVAVAAGDNPETNANRLRRTPCTYTYQEHAFVDSLESNDRRFRHRFCTSV